MSRKMKNPADVAAKWASNLGNASQAIQQGVAAVTTAPTSLAAAAVDRQVAGVMRAAQSGKTARNLQKVSLSDWQTSMIQKGLPRISSGAQAAKPKMQGFMSKFLPFLQQGVDSLPPRGDKQANINRAVAMMNHNSEFVNS